MNQPKSVRFFLYTVYFIYFFNGLALCFEGAFNPEFKEVFQLGYSQLMLTMFAKNLPFVLFSIAIGQMALRIGFQRCLTIAMFLFAAGTLLLVPGMLYRSYAIVLTGFFLIGTGFNFQLVAGNPLLSMLGDPAGSSSRLNLGNALGAIAQITGPLIITLIIPTTVLLVTDKIPYINGLFLTIVGVLILTGILTIYVKNEKSLVPTANEEENQDASEALSIFKNVRLLKGFIAIFFVLGIEAGIFGLFRNYIQDPAVAGLNPVQSQRLFTVYFAIFALGRIVGSIVQKKIKPTTSMIINTVGAIICLGITLSSRGALAVSSLMLVGFFISIFFPTLYSISIEGLGKATAKASGLLTMGFLGAAIIPLVQGKLADVIGLHSSFAIAIIPYLYVLYFALWGHKSPAKVNSKLL